MLRPLDEARNVVERADPGERVDLAADRRHVHAGNAPAAGLERNAAGEALNHRALGLPAQSKIPVGLGAARDRIEARDRAQKILNVRIDEPKRCLPGRLRPAREAAVGLQRAVEEPAREGTQRQRPVGCGEIDAGLLDTVGTEDEGLGVEREHAGKPIEGREIDGLVRPERGSPRILVCAAGARQAQHVVFRLAGRHKATAQPREVEHASLKVGLEFRRFLIEAERDTAGQSAFADRRVDIGEIDHRPASGNRAPDPQRAEGSVSRHAADQGVEQGPGLQVGDVHIKRVFRRRERVRDLAAHQNGRAGRLSDQIERDGVEIAADPSVHLEFAQPRDDGRRREPGGTREGGGLRCVEPERQRGCGRVERLVHVAGERDLRRAGLQGEIERQRLLVARERAGQRGLAERLGANVGVDVEERGHAFERIRRAFDREIEARLRCDRARHARDRDACAHGVVDRRPAHGEIALAEGGVELQPGQANAAVGERIDAERDIGVDLVEYGPEIVASAIRRRLCHLHRRVIRVSGPGRLRGDGFA